MSTGIPLDSNFKNVSCQLGGLRLNGIVSQGTAQSKNVITIDDQNAIVVDTSGSISTNKYLPVIIGGTRYYLPLYQ